jgi:hypothetical protein
MILVTSPAKPFSFTAKGTMRRQAIVKDYEPEIEALYKSIEESSQGEITAPTEWSTESTLEFMRKTVQTVLNNSVKDDDDFFQYGCDRSVSIHTAILSDAESLLLVSKRHGSEILWPVPCETRPKAM